MEQHICDSLFKPVCPLLGGCPRWEVKNMEVSIWYFETCHLFPIFGVSFVRGSILATPPRYTAIVITFFRRWIKNKKLQVPHLPVGYLSRQQPACFLLVELKSELRGKLQTVERVCRGQTCTCKGHTHSARAACAGSLLTEGGGKGFNLLCYPLIQFK